MGMSMQQLLAAKRNEMLKLAAEGNGVTASSNQETGMASSTPFRLPAFNTTNTANKLVQKHQLDKKLESKSLAVYEDDKKRPLKKVIRAKGGKNIAIDGFFYAKEEEDIKVLDQYAAKKRVVKLPSPPAVVDKEE